MDSEGMRSEVVANIGWGADGLCAGIIAGEFYKFSDDERRSIFETVVESAGGKIPVLVGVSHSGTECAVRHAKFAEDIGADGVVTMAPYFNHTPSRAVVKSHISSICKSTNLPVMLQDAEDVRQTEIILQ